MLKDGVYFFFWNMEVFFRYFCSFLEVNDLIVGRMVFDGYIVGYDSGFNFVILCLCRNDNVRVV